MRKRLVSAIAAITLCGTLAMADTKGVETYHLLFRTGTLDAMPAGAALVYRRDVENSLLPQAAERDSGRIIVGTGPEDDVVMTFEQGDKRRLIGTFPASIGNPMIMYFVETVARDMAETAGGSPFYIRNRLKEALVRSAEVHEVQAAFDGHGVEAQTLTLRPFEHDPNRQRMYGFADIALTVTMSDDVPGWYHTLRAEVPGTEDGGPVYVSTVMLTAVEGGE
ncbi:hypothetical protein RGUI_0963 [Rhodovulum sp. P5]|uniref:hypothetical protein n=1 Tax=Rhodovulum sp. P5 TaxID=1564506 RepID=UPI0009C2239D|nr:hypothetical protein [Rhodovulum sp. P5]ARE39104.1 hypothetical protein RGUI_0963 [Rhodovulum sp. P5]